MRSQAVLVAIGVNGEGWRCVPPVELAKWARRYPKWCNWVEENIGEILGFYRLPRRHHTLLKSTKILELLMEEIKRRTLVVRIFPNVAACLRLTRAVAV